MTVDLGVRLRNELASILDFAATRVLSDNSFKRQLATSPWHVQREPCMYDTFYILFGTDESKDEIIERERPWLVAAIPN